tara:strand:+ start:213 stop:641 length:429 start_codon:yes stop_codon:yes gene_type:complete
MKLIAHRGNITGPEPERENTIDYIEEAIQLGYDVEIDVNLHNGSFYLGHDKPEQEVLPNWLLRFKDFLWCHAKDIPAFEMLLDLNMHTFMHDKDVAALTSKKYIWTNPGEKLGQNSIAVMPKTSVPQNIAGICTDNMETYNE